MTIRIVRAGPSTTVQDLGRHGHQHEGVPEAGAMDAHAARIANLLVGNDENEAVLEATLAGPTIVFGRDTVFAVAGADFAARIDGAPVSRWRSHRASSGSTLELGSAVGGCRAYIAFDGGIDVPVVLGSRSTYLLAGFGGHEGRPLRAGDRLPLGSSDPAAASAPAARSLAHSLVPRYDRTLRVVPGAHLDRLTDEARMMFWNTEFVLSPRSDRMGYRLNGPPLEMMDSTEILSAAVTMGTIQLPVAGTPILLMADRQTTGGYPRLGQIASVDLGSAAQLKPGDAIRFMQISLEDAQRMYLERARAVSALRRALAQSP